MSLPLHRSSQIGVGFNRGHPKSPQFGVDFSNSMPIGADFRGYSPVSLCLRGGFAVCQKIADFSAFCSLLSSAKSAAHLRSFASDLRPFRANLRQIISWAWGSGSGHTPAANGWSRCGFQIGIPSGIRQSSPATPFSGEGERARRRFLRHSGQRHVYDISLISHISVIHK